MKLSPIRRLTISHLNAITAILFIAILGTCSFAVFGLRPTDTHELRLNATGVRSNPELFDKKQPLTQQQAQSIALIRKPGAAIKKVETVKADSGEVVHNVYFTDGTKVAVAAKDGTSSNPMPETAPQVTPEPTIQPTVSPPDTSTPSTSSDTKTTQVQSTPAPENIAPEFQTE